MELEQCLTNRRSIRSYIDKPVSKETLIQLIEAAQKAPSWKNSQVSRYYIVNTPEKKAEFMQCLPEFNQNSTKDAPAFIVTTIVKNRSGFERDGSYTTHLKEGFQYFDNGLQVQNLCLKAYELGLGTLIMGIYSEPKVRELLQVPEDQDIVSIISVGYHDISPEMPKRKAVDDIVTFIE